MRSTMAPPSYPRVCAHRGLSGLCPENTLPAFAAAVALGTHEIELDVWASRDGELVVCHDDDVARTSNGRGRIRDMTWPEIRVLDGGSWFRTIALGDNPDPYMRSCGEFGQPVAWDHTPLCRLGDVFAQFGGKVVMNLHLKEAGTDGAVVRRTAELARAFGLTHSVYIAGWNDVLEAAARHAPEMERCCLDGQSEGTLVDNAIRFQCRRLQFWNPHFTDADIARAKAHGMICNLFHCDDPAAARAFLARGIDVILTNYANRLLPVIRACCARDSIRTIA